ncbi:hypothetical protein DSC45_22360 [Streptomyces sp. YIM 130001]|nr:hypothetical protein DSC45_22360 [Streptomyces sp. YIM 130001]
MTTIESAARAAPGPRADPAPRAAPGDLAEQPT